MYIICTVMLRSASSVNTGVTELGVLPRDSYIRRAFHVNNHESLGDFTCITHNLRVTLSLPTDKTLVSLIDRCGKMYYFAVDIQLFIRSLILRVLVLAL